MKKTAEKLSLKIVFTIFYPFPARSLPPKKNAPFVCIESWYGRCDSINYKGEWKKRKRGNRFEAGKTFKGGYDIEAF